MTLNQAMSVGALGFAAFAVVVYMRTRKNVNDNAAGQPGQLQRDAGLAAWNSQADILNRVADQAWGHYADELTRKLNQ